MKVALAASCVLAATSAALVSALAPLEPSSGIMLGVWMDTNPGADTPTDFNARFGHNVAMVHLAQNIPLDYSALAPVSLIDATNTNAILYLTVYPVGSADALSDVQIQELVKQVTTYASSGRGVLLRLAPEMNGSWQPYGQRPIAYKRMWTRVVTAIRAVPTNVGRVGFVWGPNVAGVASGGYPFSGETYSMTAAINATEFAALDTNGDGALTEADDAYSPYYPGASMVDWVGLSTYWFGPSYPYVTNAVATGGYMNSLIHGAAGGGLGVDFYATYSAATSTPFIITESAAAFHEYLIANATAPAELSPIPVGPGELAVKQSWWQEYLTNTTFLDAHPLIKAATLFEFEKPEETTMRDFRIANKTNILAAFKTDFEASTVLSRYFFATAANIVTDGSSSGTTTPTSGGSTGSTGSTSPSAGTPATTGTATRSSAGVSNSATLAFAGLVAAVGAFVANVL
ncbi:hypothetical protein HKX48_000992 [Thoreauomyces humboldtii]|nr:hypothetical protein HKX48_000992 [Thoreauomyces humboldtii]